MSEDDETLGGDVAGDQDEVDRIVDAYELAVEAMRQVAKVMRAEEGRLVERERVREELGATRAELRALRAARMGIVEARKQLQPALEKAEARLRGFEREWFEPEV